ncbi:isocitrate/isopropylmalate family dehydrogenase, partial [Klebsiella aerogenes]|uniref:isocitrate/isopropylmalate family dehydrogenase n=1 Tax=Klebsiella aerogenes TaxID=548 RepID=UPI001EF91068
SAPDLAGKDLANPCSLIGSAGMLLGWLGERRGDPRLLAAAGLIERAIDRVVADPASRTRDLGGTLGTKAFAACLIEALPAAA